MTEASRNNRRPEPAAGDVEAVGRAIETLPPGPFDYLTTALPGQHSGRGHVYLIDATGKKIASIWGAADAKVALVEWIISARAASATLPPPAAGDARAEVERLALRIDMTDRAVRAWRRAYFRDNPANTYLANIFNDILRVLGTFETDAARNQDRERTALAQGQTGDER